ncbi:MAG: 2OG-Fe(II) oxygenase [Blastomonas sp.]
MAIAKPSDFRVEPVSPAPFDHLLIDDYLDPALYAELAASFPDCPPNSGPTGYTLYWGDPEYDRLIAEHPAWKRFFELFHNQDFVEYSIAQFEQAFASQGKVDLSHPRYVPYAESRADKARQQLARPEHDPDELWVRVDIMQGRIGYDRQPHLDHRRRAITLLIYFCEPGEGGDLLLHDRNGDTHKVEPKPNRMVMFPCNQYSVHSVTPIIAQSQYRNTVQVTVSSSVDIWPGMPGIPALRSMAGKVLRRLHLRA